jgi:hypothetical protein
VQSEDPLWRAQLATMLQLSLTALVRYRRLDAPAPDVVIAELCVGATLPLHPTTELPLLLGPDGLLNEVSHT